VSGHGYLESLAPFGMKLGLERISALLEELEQPQERLDAIHVVGTNGKSSTVRFAAAALTASGLRTGAYLSPHVIGWDERVQIDGRPIVYLDSGATSQKPEAVLKALDDYYRYHNANIHRSVYLLAQEATELFEGARDRIAAFLNWPANCTIFTKNATEALNLVAYSWGRANVGPGDRVVVTQLEHHSNFVPWHMLCEQTGAQFEMVEVDDECVLQLDQLDALLATGTVKLVAVAHVSNAAGTINPVAEIVQRAGQGVAGHLS